MNTKYLLQSCSDAVLIPVLRVPYLLISSNAYLSYFCSCVDTARFFSLLKNFWRVDEILQPNGDAVSCAKRTQFRIIHILKHGAVKVTLIFYVYLQKLEKSDLDNWENIRGPQLWEDSRAVQQQRREAARLKTE